MQIQKATITQLPQILKIYQQARRFMKMHHNPIQWKNYPPKQLLIDDIANQKLYVCMKNDKILGVFYYAKEKGATYQNIDGKWLNEKFYGVVYRIASIYKTVGCIV